MEGMHPYQRHQPPAPATTPSAHGSLAPSGFCCPTHPHSYDPIRQSRGLPPISQGHWLYAGSLPDDLVWAVPETFPALSQRSVPACHPPCAGRRAGCNCPVLPPLQWPSPVLQWVGSYKSPDTDFRRGVITTLQGSLQAAARRLARLPGSIRPNAKASAAEDVYTRACSRSDHSPPESGMTTQHHRLDTVTGLTPAGTLPLQAARKT